ncbi:hypothetical protein HK105_203013 [Polyrhizophydium stewartii]|uniref:Phospholipid/glycerol acyltransferase domain-containing protein n=1 Tax=Polyrhizophydium stewartii TaxID=2732419 RepID=A0ABR4NCS6_9FUNG|nr:hypothetical protein HK105_000627 [Polyrhizophydium stewartii]
MTPAADEPSASTTARADPLLVQASPSQEPALALADKPSRSASFVVRPRASNPSKDIMPGFEERIQQRDGPSFASSCVLQDGLALMAYGAQAIAQDEFSKCFTQKPRNSLRTLLFNGPLYLLDGFVRYLILFPLRLALMLVASIIFFICIPIVLQLNDEQWQRWLFNFYCSAFVASWGGRIKYHGQKPRLTVPHIFVANHTSVIDYVILSAHSYPHATVAQKHGGLIGYFEHSVLTLNGSLMFNRNEKKDRSVLARKMREHVADPSRVPLLIFPEGTCVNNEYTVLFHKGAFELGATVVPVAIKYNKNWADAYWHSKTQSFTYHLLYLMTRWALVADVWYLEPRSLRPGQSSADFANEVKAEISQVAKLKNLSWDGYFKNYAPPVEKRVQLKKNPQTRYGAVLRKRLNGNGHIRRSSYSSPDLVHHADFVPSQPPAYLDKAEYDTMQASTSSKNRVLVALNDTERSQDMIEAIANRRSNIVDTWKRFTKMRSADDELRRVENSSWRLWFKQRIDQQRREEKLRREQLKLQRLEIEVENARAERQRWASSDSSGVLGMVQAYLPSPTSLFGDGADDGPMRRARSFGSALSALSITSLGTRVDSRRHDKPGSGGSKDRSRSHSRPRGPAMFTLAGDDDVSDNDEN